MLRRVRESIIKTELVAGEKNIPLRRMYNAAVLRAGGGEEKSSVPPLEPNLFFIHPEVETFVNSKPLLSNAVEKVVPLHTVAYDTISDSLIILRRVDHKKMNTFRSYVHNYLNVIKDTYTYKKVAPHADKLYVYHGVDYDAPVEKWFKRF